MSNDSPNVRDYLALLERVPELFRRAFDAIAVYDVDGRLVAGNAAARKMVGENLAGSLAGRHFTEHLALEEARAAARVFAHVVTTGEPTDAETTFRDGDGSPIPVMTRLVPAKLDGKIVGVIGFARDMRLQRSVEGQFIRSEQQFQSIFENHPDALAVLDLKARFVRVNAGCERLTGYTLEEMVGQTPAMVSPTGVWDDEVRILEAVRRGETVEYRTVVQAKSGERRHVEGRALPMNFGDEIRGFYMLTHDVTDERRRERDSARQANRVADLYRIAATPSVPPEEKIERALVTAMRELSADWAYVGRLHEGMMTLTYTAGSGPGAFEVGTSIEIERAVIRHALAADDLFVAEDLRKPPYNADLAGKRSVWRSFVGMPLAVDGEQYGALGFATVKQMVQFGPADRDYIKAAAGLIASAVQQAQRDQRLDTLAFHDPLTGLPNRALLHDRLEQTLLGARRNKRSFAAHYIDIDHFKAINDTHGHHVGDVILVAVASWLKASLRDSDTIARIGGDEFVVLQPEIESQQQAEDLAAKLVAIRGNPFRVGTKNFTITVSVGGAVFPWDALNPEDLLTQADAALYEVKARGRDGYSVGTVR